MEEEARVEQSILHSSCVVLKIFSALDLDELFEGGGVLMQLDNTTDYCS